MKSAVNTTFCTVTSQIIRTQARVEYYICHLEHTIYGLQRQIRGSFYVQSINVDIHLHLRGHGFFLRPTTVGQFQYMQSTVNNKRTFWTRKNVHAANVVQWAFVVAIMMVPLEWIGIIWVHKKVNILLVSAILKVVIAATLVVAIFLAVILVARAARCLVTVEAFSVKLKESSHIFAQLIAQKSTEFL